VIGKSPRNNCARTEGPFSATRRSGPPSATRRFSSAGANQLGFSDTL